MNNTLQFQHLKVLGDSQRLAILRRLMKAPATLSQLGEHFGASPAHIRHHLKILEKAGLVELSSTHAVRGFLEKYYRATQQAYLVQLTILPDTSEERPLLVLGSNDPALRDILLQQPFPAPVRPGCLILNLDSLEGLVKLREDVCTMATIHLLASDDGIYNKPYVQHFFPGEEMALIRLYQREEGFLLPAGNPLKIHDVNDLARSGIRIVNRERGAGTRVWLDATLHRLGIHSDQVVGYANEVSSHQEVAQTVAMGNADLGIGLPASAQQYGLEFLPLFSEPYELVLSLRSYKDQRFSHLFDFIASKQFQDSIQRHPGYHGLQDRGQATIII